SSIPTNGDESRAPFGNGPELVDGALASAGLLDSCVLAPLGECRLAAGTPFEQLRVRLCARGFVARWSHLAGFERVRRVAAVRVVPASVEDSLALGPGLLFDKLASLRFLRARDAHGHARAEVTLLALAVRAVQVWAERTRFLHRGGSAFRAAVARLGRRGDENGIPLLIHRQRVGTFGVARASEELSVPAPLDDHIRLVTDVAADIRLLFLLDGVFFRVFELPVELRPELLEYVDVLTVALGNLVELLFHLARERHRHVVRHVFHEQVVHEETQLLGDKRASL